MSTAPYVEACDLLTGPTLREARIAIPAGELDLEGLAAVGDPAPGEAQFLRFVPEPLNAARAPTLAVAPGAPAVLGTGTSRAGGSRRPAGRCRPRHLVAASWPSPGRHGRGSVGALRRDPREGPSGGLSRPRRPPGPLGDPALHVLLRDERLAIDLRGSQRPRGRPRAMFRRVRGARRRHDRAGMVLRGGARREGRRPATPLGRPADGDDRRAPVVYPGRRLARDLPRTRRVHHAAAVPR